MALVYYKLLGVLSVTSSGFNVELKLLFGVSVPGAATVTLTAPTAPMRRAAAQRVADTAARASGRVPRAAACPTPGAATPSTTAATERMSTTACAR